MTEQDRPRITSDDANDDETKGLIVSGGTDRDALGDESDSGTLSQNGRRGEGTKRPMTVPASAAARQCCLHEPHCGC